MKTNEQLAHKGSAFSRRDFLKVTGAGLSFALVFGAAGVKVLSAQGSSRLRHHLLDLLCHRREGSLLEKADPQPLHLASQSLRQGHGC